MVGFGVADALVRDITDPESGEVYPALSCCNNPEWAARCTTSGAEKAIWAINASDKFNSECAVLLREGFRSGKIRLPVTEYDGEKYLATIKGYSSLDDSDKLLMQMPYVNTTLLVNELINLQHDESGGLVKISKKKNKRKDRYSSLSYNYWVACELEKKISKKKNSSFKSNDVFMFRAPKIKK